LGNAVADDVTGESSQFFVADCPTTDGTLSGTRTFEIAGGTTEIYVLAWKEFQGSGKASSRNLIGLFTPAN
jgi:hypothetical protein